MKIHPLRLRYSNAYLLVGEQPILVDTGSRGDAPRIEAALAAAGVALRDLALILHTHVHSDHFGNTAELAAKAGCPVSFHLADHTLAAQGRNGRLQGIGLRGRVLARLCENLPFRSIDAGIPAEEGMRLEPFGVGGSILHTPGHTAGSITVLLDSGAAIVGDTIMGGWAGGAIRRAKPNFHYFAEDLPLAMASLDRILAAAAGQLFVGHGGPLDREDVARWRSTHGMASLRGGSP
jgi:hydroxyacylglutathione hydrolase